MSVNNNQTGGRIAEIKGVAFLFTKYLIQTRFINPKNCKVKRKDLIDRYVEFQANQPSFVKKEEIIYALSIAHILRKKTGADVNDFVEFKDLVFQQHLENVPMNMDDLIRPKIRVFVNQSAVFRNAGTRASPVEGLQCKICNQTCSDTVDLEKHLASELHLLRNQYRIEKNKFLRSVRGLEITDVNLNLEKEERCTCKVTFKNVSKKPVKVFRIQKTYLLVDLPQVTTTLYKPTDLKAGDTFEFTMNVRFPRYGAYEFPIVTVIEDKSENTTIKLLSVPTFRVMKEEVRDLGPISPFQPPVQKTVRFEDLPLISGVPLPSKFHLFYKVPLSQYPLPVSVNRILNRGLKASATVPADAEILNKMRQLLCNSVGSKVLHNQIGLRPENYVERFRYLLYIEEHAMNQDMLAYNQNDADLLLDRKFNGLFGLQVPGLSEGRPSILKGDSVYVRPGEKAKSKYEGVVHEVQENTAYLALNSSFKYIAKQKVGIEFSLNRISMRICHRALEQIQKENLVSLLFPSEKMGASVRPTIGKFYNKNIGTNPEQKKAVNNIVHNTAYPAPYIIYGPPGTGKTATVVEAIAQLYFKGIGLKVCACAPSNAAADLIAKRLLKNGVPKTAIFRLYSMSVSSRNIPTELKDCSNFDPMEKDIPFPREGTIKSKSIIILTPITAGRLYGVLGESYFNYLFIDEAGHAEEPLTLVPIIGLLKRKQGYEIGGSLVLAGDPKQLGPIIHSKLARHLGLDMPLIERLMVQSPLYKKQTNGMYDDRVITKLLKNYRSHPVLLKLPNELFYDNSLEASADHSRIDCLSSWEQLPKKSFPLVFHGVRGKDDRESNSPSYFNQLEIMHIGEYLKELVDCRIKGYLVKQDDIVILTPYRKQVQKIRQYLAKKKWDKITVNSVEQFQGQEKLIVIISTVRSRQEFLSSDYQFGLGFLRNPKRFNVAITRAIALTIIIGNPDVLQCDSNWRALLKYCRENNAYKGVLPAAEVSDDLDPNATLALDLSALTLTAASIPESEKPSFPTAE